MDTPKWLSWLRRAFGGLLSIVGSIGGWWFFFSTDPPIPTIKLWLQGQSMPTLNPFIVFCVVLLSIGLLLLVWDTRWMLRLKLRTGLTKKPAVQDRPSTLIHVSQHVPPSRTVIKGMVVKTEVEQADKAVSKETDRDLGWSRQGGVQWQGWLRNGKIVIDGPRCTKDGDDLVYCVYGLMFARAVREGDFFGSKGIAGLLVCPTCDQRYGHNTTVVIGLRDCRKAAMEHFKRNL